MTEIFIQLREAIVVIEAPQHPDEIVEKLRSDGYDAKQVSGMVVVREKIASAQVSP